MNSEIATAANSDFIDLYPMGRSGNFRITRDRSISIPSDAMIQLAWKYGDKIASRLILAPLTLLLWAAPSNGEGFILHPNGVKPKDGVRSGKLSMSHFINRYLDGHFYNISTDTPIDISPAYVRLKPYQVALTFQDANWTAPAAFLPLPIKALSSEDKGIYCLLDQQGVAVKIGQGHLASRISTHYDDLEKRSVVSHFTYFLTSPKLLRILEQVVIAQHVAKYGCLPIFNKRHF